MSLQIYGPTAVHLNRNGSNIDVPQVGIISGSPIYNTYPTWLVHNPHNQLLMCVTEANASVPNGVLHSSDGGAFWAFVSTIPAGISVRYAAYDSNAHRVVGVNTSTASLAMSTHYVHGAAMWALGGNKPATLTDCLFYGVIFHPNTGRLVAVGTKPSDTTLYSAYSTDGGDTWTAGGTAAGLPITGAQLSNLNYSPTTGAIMCVPNDISGSSFMNYFYSLNGGLSWTNMTSTALLNSQATQLKQIACHSTSALGILPATGGSIMYKKASVATTASDWVNAGAKGSSVLQRMAVYDPINSAFISVPSFSGQIALRNTITRINTAQAWSSYGAMPSSIPVNTSFQTAVFDPYFNRFVAISRSPNNTVPVQAIYIPLA